MATTGLDKQLAIIREVGFGMRDCNHPVLWFSTFIGEGSAALQVFGLEQAGQIIEAYGVHDVRQLEGKPCWVDTSDPGLIRWVGPCRLTWRMPRQPAPEAHQGA